MATYPFDAAANDVVGVWRIGRSGKSVELLASGKAAGMVFPNFAIFDKRGSITSETAQFTNGHMRLGVAAGDHAACI